MKNPVQDPKRPVCQFYVSIHGKWCAEPATHSRTVPIERSRKDDQTRYWPTEYYCKRHAAHVDQWNPMHPTEPLAAVKGQP